MFKTFILVGYSRGISNYLEKITLYDQTPMMSIVDPVAINVETPRIIYSGCSLDKEFTELIYINP